MNFLGHCLFSESSSAALAGSLWPDFATRPKHNVCSTTFYEHFDRHQWIDKTTDQSSILKPLRHALRPTFRKTTPIVVDMLLDHHLALHWSKYCSIDLPIFAQRSYHLLFEFSEVTTPETFDVTLYWMHKRDWFSGYQTEARVIRALEGISQRIRFKNPITEHAAEAIPLAHEFEADLQQFIGHLQANLPCKNTYRR